MEEAPAPAAPAPVPSRSWFRSDVASNLQGRVETLESFMTTMQTTFLMTLPRDVQDIRMSVADLSSRQNVVERLTVENHQALCSQFYSLAECVDEHSNLLRAKPDEQYWHANNAEHFVLSPGKTNKELDEIITDFSAKMKTFEDDLKQLASHGSGAKDRSPDETADFIKTLNRLDSWYGTLEGRADAVAGRLANFENNLMDYKDRTTDLENMTKTYNKVTDQSADLIKTLQEGRCDHDIKMSSLEAGYSDIKSQLDTTLRDIQTQILACGDALNDRQNEKSQACEASGNQNAPVLPIAQAQLGEQNGSSLMPPTLLQMPQAAAAQSAAFVPPTQYLLAQPQQQQHAGPSPSPVPDENPFNPPPGSKFAGADSGGMFSKQRLVHRNLDDVTVDAVEKPWKIMRKQTDGLPILPGGQALEKYKGWKRDMLAHISSENSRWARYLNWATKANNGISPEWLLQMQIDNYSGADLSRELYSFLFKSVDISQRTTARSGWRLCWKWLSRVARAVQ